MKRQMQRSGTLSWVSAPPSALHLIVSENPMTAREALARYPWAWAVLDGAMFRLCEGGTSYATTTCARLDYLAIDPKTGAQSMGLYPSRGATLAVLGNGQVEVRRGDGLPLPPNTMVAWQGYPTIIERGAVIAGDAVNTDRTERAAVALTFAPRPVVHLVSGVGTMAGFAREIAAALAPEVAIYTDGGQSRVLALRTNEGIEADLPSNLDARRVPSFLAFTDPLLASLSRRL